MKTTIKFSGRQRRTVYQRRIAARALLAAASPVLANYDYTRGSLIEKRFYDLATAAGHGEVIHDHWPHEGAGLGDLPGVRFRENEEAVVITPEGVISYVTLAHGWFHATTVASSRLAAELMVASFRQAYPASYLTMEDDPRVPITFWTLGAFGPIPRLRKIEAARWGDVETNYTSDVRAELSEVMAWKNGPGRDGQLMLWHGPPGTGKSWGLRALASEWAPWAEFHYITDPDAFFVRDPSYMIEVLLADSYAVIEPSSGDVYEEQKEDGKWRVLLLEDTGDLLAADRMGQGLSRLLNVVDGMIGQGLRVLALITTNDEIESLHPAVTRPGRCASQLYFGALTPEEASTWLGEAVEEGGTLAELYARRTAPQPAFVTSGDPRDEIARVAEAHVPDGGYGDAWYRESDSAVFWNAADWTSNDELDAAREAFLAIPGVERFESDAEVGSPGPGWEKVWPVAIRAAAPPDALAEVIALASSPLPELEPGDYERYGHRAP